MAPRVAVIIPCYNDGATLGESVHSVSETEPVEIVVVNDGSTDSDTLAVLAQLRTEGFNVIDRENGGLSAARMTGVAATSAPYIYPLDSDDRLDAGALSSLADALDAYPGAGFAYGNYEVFGEYRGLWISPEKFDPWAMTYANFIPVCSLLRREALLAVGGWELRTGMEDWDLWLKLAERDWDGAHVPRVVYHRRVDGARMHANARKRHRQLVESLHERHAELFASRARLAARSRPSLLKRALYPIAFGIRNRNLVPYAIESRVARVTMGRRLRKAAHD